ncbi:MAG TPA: cupin domain-containing protein [Thermoleophilia bacterium]|nr:cupin domain-containing protein [Thermoleophilia bacterium]
MPAGEDNPGDEADRRDAIEYLLTPGDPAPRTPPTDRDRYAYVVEGQLAARIGGQTHVAGPGSVVAIPRRLDHSLRSANQAYARVLVLEVGDDEGAAADGARRGATGGAAPGEAA